MPTGSAGRRCATALPFGVIAWRRWSGSRSELFWKPLSAWSTSTIGAFARCARKRMVLRRGIGRLIDSYAEGVIDKSEFEPRVAGLKTRVARLQARLQDALSEAEAQRELSLVVAHLEEFAQRVCQGLDDLDWLERREIVRALVRRIEIDHEGVEIVFRIPPPNGPPTPSSGTREDASWQHCTVGDNPALRQDDEALGLIGSLDDLHP